jgi:hypothetical protein
MHLRGEIDMKFNKIILLLAFCLIACNQSTSPDTIVLDASFALTDTLGQSKSQFHEGENFYLTFNLVNTSKDTLTYYQGNSSPPILFQILQDDSVCASSIDGYVFILVVGQGKFAPSQNLNSEWKAPTTPAQIPKVTLQPGNYKAMVFHPNFDQAEVNEIPPISFEVVQ